MGAGLLLDSPQTPAGDVALATSMHYVMEYNLGDSEFNSVMRAAENSLRCGGDGSLHINNGLQMNTDVGGGTKKIGCK